MNHNKDFEQVGIVAACILGALAALLALPVLILCGFFAYMHWGLSISKPRNMLMKAFLLGLFGYFMTIIVWQTFTTHAGTLLEVFVSPKKIDRIYTIPLFQNLGFFYPIICGVFFFVFEKKTKPSLALYNLLSGAIGVATEFGVRKKNNQDTIEEVVNELNSQSGIPIGDVIHPIQRKLTLSWRDINHHIHILGQPGVGKSVLLRNIYAKQIVINEGLILIDLKADLKIREDFRALCSGAHRTNDLMIIDLSHPESSCGYNPLLFGNATELKDKLVGSFEWSEPYYKKISERVLLTLLLGLVWLRDNGKSVPTLDDLSAALASASNMVTLSELIENTTIKDSIRELATGFTKDFYQDLESLRTELTLLTKSEFGIIFNKPDPINVLQSIKTKKVILVNLDGQTFNESAKKFGRLLLSDLRSASGAIVTNLDESERPKFTVIVDEFADIVATEDMARTFVGFLNRCRGSGIGVVIAHQSLGDFKDPTVRSQIMDSTESMFSFVQKDPESCEILAAVVGTTEVEEITRQTRSSFFMDQETGMGSKKWVHQYIYHPNVFRNLGVGEAIYAAKKPTRYGRVNIKMIEIPHTIESEQKLPISNFNYQNQTLQEAIEERKIKYSKTMSVSDNHRPRI